jgi:AraC-like DNA-binding protein
MSPDYADQRRETDRALAAASLALRGLLDEMPDTQAWIKDARRRYLWVNRSFLQNYAMASAEEVLGRTDDDLSPPHLAAHFREGDEAALAGRAVRNRLERVGRYDHTASWCVTTKLPVLGEGGRPLGTAGITRVLEPAEIERRGDIRLGAVISLMSRHLDGAVSNKRLAEAAAMSVRAFERAFVAEYGMSPQRYLRRLRLQSASRRLVATREGLAEIAAGLGFADQSHFTREFRRLTGTTPGRYREQYRGG